MEFSMRIALIGHAPMLGGTTDLFVQVRDFFKERGHDVQGIFGTGSKEMDSRVEDAVIFNSDALSWREKMRAYADLVHSHNPDLAYVIAGRYEMDLFRFLKCARVRHASTLEQHAFADIPFWLSKYRSYFEACTANTPDAVEEVKRCSQRPTFLLPYRLPQLEQSFSKVELPSKIDDSRRIEVAFVSRLEHFQKRAHWLPKIVRLCEKLGVPLNWNIYGDGPAGPFLRQHLANAANVRFHGWMDRTSLYRVLPQNDLFFLCSRWEGLPIAMVEAMRCGVACVAPDIPTGIHWTLSHGGGWLYQATSPRAAAHALADAVRDRNELLEKRRAAQRISIELFSVAQAREHYLRLEESFRKLTFNGNVLDPATAPKFQDVRPADYLKRIAYAVEKAAYSPGWLLSKITGRR